MFKVRDLPLNPLEVVRLIEDNMKRYGFPFPIPADAIYSWAKPLGLPARGSPMLYTGALYQLMPYIASIIDSLAKIEGSSVSVMALRVSRFLPGFLTGLVVKPRGEFQVYSESILRSIVKLLKTSGVNVAYPYEGDLYSGVLLYDLGLDELFREQALKVYKALKERGATTVITVDPHTTHILRSIYPRYIDGFDLEVKSYLEVLAESGFKPGYSIHRDVVIHDPCLYARFENIVDQPRNLLASIGVKYLEPRRTRRMTYCCGGPIEGLAPKMAKAIASSRLKELVEKSKSIVTLCPICYSNLKAVAGDDIEIIDIALLLSGEKS
ncbi:MAG: (Fe-S)-binding protein [Acidilobaceae archaeon]